MGASLLLSAHSVVFLVLVVSASLLPSCDPNYTECKQNFDCGLLRDLLHPFWGLPNGSEHCGGGYEFKLNCEADRYPIWRLPFFGSFRLFYVNQSEKVMSWIRQDIWDFELCPGGFTNDFVVKGPHPDANNGPPESVFLILYSGCDRNRKEVPNLYTFPCPIRGEEGRDAFYSNKKLDLPCTSRGGVWIQKTAIHLAYNNGEFENPICPGNGFDSKRKIIVGVVTASSATIVIALVLLFIRRRRKNQRKLAPSSFALQNLIYDQSSRGDLEKIRSKYYGVHVFTYAELEEATNNFDHEKELGKGGFGTVYYGKLRDGRAVAVKRLYENNYKRVEQFMNEIDILTHLRHPNLVSLYGCTSRHSRELLLVYEYIPNGTVADHLHGKKAKPGALPWHMRINIAVETASALAYLHAVDIIHRDVKTYNILLDKTFNVKVADFGLSRLFPTDVTHVSTCPQGTPGYVDPEYRECYQLTDKSDVYSFGVVLMELISSMPAVDITRHRHDINLSSMAMNKIQNDALHELVDPSLGYDTDPAVRQMINAAAELGFMCLQMEKDLRPRMDEVLQILQEIQTNDYSIENSK